MGKQQLSMSQIIAVVVVAIAVIGGILWVKGRGPAVPPEDPKEAGDVKGKDRVMGMEDTIRKAMQKGK